MPSPFQGEKPIPVRGKGGKKVHVAMDLQKVAHRAKIITLDNNNMACYVEIL
jgi:hypothetical protein